MKRKTSSKMPTATGMADQNIDPVSMGIITIKDTMSTSGAKLCFYYSRVLRAEAPGAIEGKDVEHVHRMRIAARKLRIVLQLWDPYLDKKKTKRLREEITRLTKILGFARDAAVLEDRFENQWEGGLFTGPFKDYIRQKLHQRGSTAQNGLVAALTSGRFERMLLSLEHLFNRNILFDEDHPLCAIVPRLFGFALKKTRRFDWKKLDNSELHSLRIAFKRLRYLVEFFGPLYRGKLAGYLRNLKKYQEMLGNFCDARVGEDFLTSLITGEASDTPASQRRCQEIGGLIYIQRRDAADQHQRFDKKRTMLPKLLKAIRQQTKRV